LLTASSKNVSSYYRLHAESTEAKFDSEIEDNARVQLINSSLANYQNDNAKLLTYFYNLAHVGY